MEDSLSVPFIVSCLCFRRVSATWLGIMPTGFGKSLIFQLFPRLAKAALIRCYLASVKRERRTRRNREKESAKLFSVIRSPGWSQSGNNKTVQRLLSLFRYYQGRNYAALQSKDSQYFKRNTIKLEFTNKSQCNFRPETNPTANRYVCHDLSVRNKRLKSHLLSDNVEPSRA